ncbi:two-component sensor histidine kinase [Caminibacter mediatlanticus TB-2]|uniref:histidine kinase n=1 Tax=Caminibacter mediatlanticus TB-2 TaxID=391592 RepID=A0AAI9F333_9BACT|nr:HAMP domain-containing sensor histidine kinase [Caminibacter mediatlanticus]EDM24439.1 SENSORY TRASNDUCTION HISTIDINE KINASE [Caminibacter mediatlanticus TB-2]QCT95084.1 two-component sensor histidine kinase [Caminibacter mediatlanticus TB-2]
MKNKIKNYIKKNFFKECNEIEKLKRENKRLKQINEKLKTMNSFKDEVISAISHEFKNPISIINGYIETIIESNLDEKTKIKFLKKIYNNTTRLSELIDRLYLITKLENKKLKPKFEKFRLDTVAKNLIDSFDEDRIKLNAKKIEITADKNLIDIVLRNLISNALKYSSKEIIVNINEEKVEVIDKGKGIDEKHIELIKEKFYRVAKNDWDNSLGLGLAIVEHILQLHNTKLEIESKKGKGSKFYFDITSLVNKELQQ